MNMKNSVVFKGRKDGILVMLSPELEFGELKTLLEEKSAEAAKFFSDETTAIFFTGRELNEREEVELVGIIHKATELSISFVSSSGSRVEKKSDAPPKTRARSTVSHAKELLADENVTLYHRGSLRSGQSLSYKGSIVLYGDLNPGAEIIAEGNVVVLGHAKGLVHAGCSGNAECFVFALNMQPTQLRISDIISYVNGEASQAAKQRAKYKPSFAVIRGDDIVIEPHERF